MKIECSKKPKRRPISKLASHAYTPKQIMKKALTGFHGNEPMLQVFNNIIHDPHVTLGEQDRAGRFSLFYDDEDIGWIDIERGMGWIDDKAYPKIAKYDGPLFDEEYDEYDDYDDFDDYDPEYADIDLDGAGYDGFDYPDDGDINASTSATGRYRVQFAVKGSCTIPVTASSKKEAIRLAKSKFNRANFGRLSDVSSNIDSVK